ncbi:MAG: endolytic transglycosylase MltG [Hyphomicrobiaceae bacterium]
MSAAMRWLNGLLTFLLIAMFGGTGGLIWFNHQVNSEGPLREEKLFSIPSGKGTRAIAESLEESGIISSRHVFLSHQLAHSIWERTLGRTPKQLKAGDYAIKPGATMRQVAEVIRKGKAVLVSVSVPEGLTSYQVVQRLLVNEQLTGDIGQVPPEGFLMPDTYRVPLKATRAEVVQMMAAEQRKFLSQAWEKRQPDLPFTNVSEALILASIIEKETGPKDDPARIASVFVNRMRRGMRLQSDPTILYGKFGTKVQWGSTIYRSDIEKKTTHNTYQIDGLPPTPICNPGRKSLLAALNPAQSNDLFFVSNGEGGHIFSETVAEHNRAVAQWRKIEKRIKKAQKERAVEVAQSKSRSPTPVTRINTAAIPNREKAPTATQPAPTAEFRASDGTPLPVRKPSP